MLRYALQPSHWSVPLLSSRCIAQQTEHRGVGKNSRLSIFFSLRFFYLCFFFGLTKKNNATAFDNNRSENIGWLTRGSKQMKWQCGGPLLSESKVGSGTRNPIKYFQSRANISIRHTTRVLRICIFPFHATTTTKNELPNALFFRCNSACIFLRLRDCILHARDAIFGFLSFFFMLVKFIHANAHNSDNFLSWARAQN